MSGGEPSSIKRSVSCAAASLHTYVPDIFFRTVTHFMDFLRKLAGFWLDFSPWLLVHIIVFSLVGGYLGYDVLGAQGVAYYYTVILLSLAAALIFSVIAYFAFGRRDLRYTLNRADPFDRRRIYSCDAVIDMDMLSYSESLEKLKEVEQDDSLDDPQKAVLYYYIGKCYQYMGYPSNGAKYFCDAIEKGFVAEEAYLFAARCLVQNGSFDEAIKYYSVLVSNGCMFDFIYTDVGLAYLKKGDGETALSYFLRSIKEGKNYAFALGGCSLAYLNMKDLPRSEEFYRKALACNMSDIYGFKVYYCNIAESLGLIDDINPNIRKSMITGHEILR